MENGSESARQEKRRSVQAAGAFRYCPLPEHAEKSAGRRPVSRFREVVPRHGNLGGNTESFRPNSKGEKAFYFLLRRKKYMLDLKFLRENPEIVKQIRQIVHREHTESTIFRFKNKSSYL